jgi:DNA-directed RNA polymerase
MSSIHNGDEFEKIAKEYQLPYPTEAEFDEKHTELVCWNRSSAVNYVSRLVYDRGSKHLRTKSVDFMNINEITSECGVTQIEKDAIMHREYVAEEELQLKSRRLLFNSVLVLGNIFIGFPLYYGTRVDYRFRMYPWQALISRVSGALKHCLCDYSEEKLTLEGFIWLNKAYFASD